MKKFLLLALLGAPTITAMKALTRKQCHQVVHTLVEEMPQETLEVISQHMMDDFGFFDFIRTRMMFCLPLSGQERSVSLGDIAAGFCVGTTPSGKVFLWNLETGNLLKSWSPFGESTVTARLTKDGSMVVVYHQNTITLWETSSCMLLATVQVKDGDIVGVSFSADNRLILAYGDTGVTVWSLAEGKLIRFFPHERLSTQSSVHLNPQGTQLLVGDGEHPTCIYDTATGEVRSTYPPAHTARFSHDGSMILIIPNRGSVVEVHFLYEEREPLRLYDGESSYVSHACFTPDDSMVLMSGTSAHKACFFDLESGRRRETIRYGRGNVQVRLSDDGQFMTAHSQTGVDFWSVTTGCCSHTFFFSSRQKPRLVGSGEWLVLQGEDGVEVYNLQTPYLLRNRLSLLPTYLMYLLYEKSSGLGIIKCTLQSLIPDLYERLPEELQRQINSLMGELHGQ